MTKRSSCSRARGRASPIARARTVSSAAASRPLAELRAAGVAVWIATDSPASTPSLDIFEELRTAIVAARARERRPDALTATDALELATLGGARVLGMDDGIGSLVPGKQADLAVISLRELSVRPVEDPVTAVVLGRLSGACHSYSGGRRAALPERNDPMARFERAARSARSRMLP